MREHFREKAAECLIQPHHPPANIIGGYPFPDAPVVDLPAPIEPAPMPTTAGYEIPDDLTISRFPATASAAARSAA